MSDLGKVAGLTPAYYAYVEGFNMAGFASFTLIAYYVLITWDDEIEYVWRSKWSIAKCLFLCSRYFSLTGVGAIYFATTPVNSAAFCSIFTAFEFLWTLVVGFTCDGLLLMRVIALFNGRRWLCRALYSLFGLVYTVEAILTAYYFYNQTHSSATSAPGALLDCSAISALAEEGVVVTLATLPLLLFNALLFILTLFHLFPYWRAGGLSGTDLLTLFLKQGTLYFAIAFAAFVLEAVIPLERLAPTFCPWLVLIPIASNRLFISLRKQVGTAATVEETMRGVSTLHHVISLRATDDLEEDELHDIRRDRAGTV